MTMLYVARQARQSRRDSYQFVGRRVRDPHWAKTHGVTIIVEHNGRERIPVSGRTYIARSGVGFTSW